MSSDIRAIWHVTAGMTIGNVLPDYSRSFTFSNEDAEGPASAALFASSARAALEYAYGLYSPDQLRWVRLEFVWDSLANGHAGARPDECSRESGFDNDNDFDPSQNDTAV